jgi:hypothetical protein
VTRRHRWTCERFEQKSVSKRLPGDCYAELKTVKVKSKATKLKQSKREKAHRDAWRALGLCTRCGKSRPPAGRRQCGQCGQRNIENLTTHRSRKALFGDDGPRRIQDRNQSIELFNTALKAEVFGNHQGFVDVKIRPFIYNPVSQRQERLPGLDIELLVATESEVHEMFTIMRRAIDDWLKGISPYQIR